MRKMSALVGFVVLALVSGSGLLAQGQAKAMTNDDVVAMVKAELPEDTIISAIGAQDTNFDSSALALVALKKEGVSAKVMDVMLAAAKKRRESTTTATTSTAAPTPAPAAKDTAPPPAGANQFTATAPAATTPAANPSQAGTA